MRSFIVILTATFIGLASALAAPAINLNSKDGVLAFINAFDAKRDLARGPTAFRTASNVGALSDPESSGIYIGFLAGLIGSNPEKADTIIEGVLGIREADQWAIVRAIAYSEHPDWRGLMARYASRIPTREVMAQRYLEGKLQTFDTPKPEDTSKWHDKVNPGKWFAKKKEKPIPIEERTEMLDVLWGYYFASRSARPMERMIKMLPWSEDRDSFERLTIGSMAKFTMAMNASRDQRLLALLKAQKPEDETAAKQLAEVIEAAETVELTTLRKTALTRMEDLKRMGPGYKRDVAWWGQIGQGALAMGCVAAAATGQIQFGLPCVLGGAASSAALNFWTAP